MSTSNIPTIYRIGFAVDPGTGKKFRVWPISAGEKLASLKRIDSKGHETGERTRVPIGDLFEFYKLLDHQGKVISRPEDHGY